MDPEIQLWAVWFTHSDCDPTVCPVLAAGPDPHDSWQFDNWTEAAAEIESRLDGRPEGCELDAIVERDVMAKSAWEALLAEDAAATPERKA